MPGGIDPESGTAHNTDALGRGGTPHIVLQLVLSASKRDRTEKVTGLLGIRRQRQQHYQNPE
jgi:hypothetical protein